MEILCKNKASGCLITLDDFDVNNSVIRIRKFDSDCIYEGKVDISEIILVISGSAILNSQTINNYRIEEKTAILLPIGSNYTLAVKEQTETVICRLDSNVRLCDFYTLDSLLDDIPEPDNSFTAIKLNEKLLDFATGVSSYISDGLVCDHFLRTKMTEMFYIFRAYYPKEVIAHFFLPLINKDSKFADFIYNNWQKVKSLNELAAMYNLSLSGFTKKFKKVFGIAPYKWIMNKKGELIYTELRCSDKSIKQMSIDYNFCSVQHFCDYCKKKFGMPPGKIRHGAKTTSVK